MRPSVGIVGGGILGMTAAYRLAQAGVAVSLYERAPAQHKQLLVWEDGDHCIYNHAHEKHSAIADFFQEALRL